MVVTRGSAARSAAVLLTLVLMTIVVSPVASLAQEPSPDASPVATTSGVGSPVLGGVLADDEGRGASKAPLLRLGTALAGMALTGDRSAFAPGETAAFRLELARPVDSSRLSVQLVGEAAGIAAAWALPDWPADPAWDTLAGTFGVPDAGDYALRVYRAGTLLVETPLAVNDVPRLRSLLTDPYGLMADETDRVVAAQQSYDDATGGGWLWTVLIDTSGDLSAAEYAADLWAVNADQLDPRDALFVAAAGDVDVSIVVGAEAARTIVPEEIDDIESEAAFALDEQRFGDMVDAVAAGLVSAHENEPQARPTPTPRPTATPQPSPFRNPDFVGMTRRDAEVLARQNDLVLRITTRQSTEVPRGTVISQDPAANRPVRPGDTVDLVVATTPATIAVPDVTGFEEADAIAVLLDAGLQLGARTERSSGTITRGDVIRTIPAAGTQVIPGSRVDYVVSRGPSATARPTTAPVEVPDVVGQDEVDAITTLLDAGLDLGARTTKRSNVIPEGAIIRTIPSAGTFVAPGTRIDYVVSLGPSVKPTTPAATPTPTPTRSPRPTPTPTPKPTPVKPTPEPTAEPTPITGDLLARIQQAGVIRVNVDADDAPWSSEAEDGTVSGFDVAVARQLARNLGVDVRFTTIPLDQVVVGGWGDRFDIAVQHLAITDDRLALLDITRPYAFDPAQLAVTDASGLGAPDELADRAICVASLGSGQAWLDGTLALTDPPLEPVAPPAGASAFTATSDAECMALVKGGGAPFDGWLASRPVVDGAVVDGLPVTAVGDPVFWAPIGVGLDRSVPDGASLLAELDRIIEEMQSDGTLTKLSLRAFDGQDLATVPGADLPGAPAPGGDAPSSVDPVVVKAFPVAVGAETIEPLAIDGAQLEALLAPASPDVGRGASALHALYGATGTVPADLHLAIGTAVDDAGNAAHITGARLVGVSGADLAPALGELLSSAYADPRSASANAAGKPVTRISDGAFSTGDRALYLYVDGDVAWAVEAVPPMIGRVLRALP